MTLSSLVVEVAMGCMSVSLVVGLEIGGCDHLRYGGKMDVSLCTLGRCRLLHVVAGGS